MKGNPDVTGPTVRKWLGTKNKVKRKVGFKEVKIEESLSTPQVVKALLEYAASKEVPAILVRTVADIQTD